MPVQLARSRPIPGPLGVLALKRNHVWPRRRYGIRALLAQTSYDDALAYAEASRGLNIPEAAVDAECETILLAAGRREQAYRQYAFRANKTDISVVTFQIITRKYPEVERRRVLADLASWSGDAGKWFTVAKNEAYFRFVRRIRGLIRAQAACQVSGRGPFRELGTCGSRRIFSW